MSKKIKYLLIGLLTVTFIGYSSLNKINQNRIHAIGAAQQSVASTGLQMKDINPQVIPLDNIFSVPVGSNSKVVDNKYVQITDSLKNQIGSIFSDENNKLDLTKNNRLEMYIKINGVADGITFALHNDYERTQKFTGVNGAGLGVYASKKTEIGDLVGQLKKSFVVEFDTQYNKDSYDGYVDSNSNRGHVAHSFPDKKIVYIFEGTKLRNQAHYMPQYPVFSLGDDKWRSFKVNWKAFDEKGVGELTYQLEGLTPVTVKIERTIFEADSVYWGFTGSTGTLFESVMVGFVRIPGLVNYEDSLDLYSENGDLLENDGLQKPDSETTVRYSGRYISGKLDFLNPSITFEKDPKQQFVEGSMTVNGIPVNPTVTDTTIKTDFSNLTSQNSSVDIVFKVKNSSLTSEDRPQIVSKVEGTNYIQLEWQSASYIVDNQAPTGVGKLTVIDQFDAEKITNAVDYKAFLRKLRDDFAPNDKLSASLKAGQAIETLVQELGPKSFEVVLTDSVGNAREITVPIFVKDTTDQIMNNDDFLLKGKNFSFIDYNYPKTATELKTFILKQSSFELWQFLDDGTAKKLDANTTTIDISKLPKPGTEPPIKEYSVPIKYTSGTTALVLIIKFNVEIGTSSVTINFLNEASQPLREPIVLTEKIGTVIDLTKQVAVQNTLKELNVDHYEQVKAPDNESAILIERNAKTVAYHYQGTLFIKSFPTKMNFGDKYLTSTFIKAEQPIYDVPLIVGDNRTNKTPWKLTATLEKALTSVKDPNEVMSRALWYKKNEGEKVMLSQGEAQEIEVGTISDNGEYNVSNNWDANKTGLQLNLYSNEVIQTGKYQATILWQIGKTP